MLAGLQAYVAGTTGVDEKGRPYRVHGVHMGALFIGPLITVERSKHHTSEFEVLLQLQGVSRAIICCMACSWGPAAMALLWLGFFGNTATAWPAAGVEQGREGGGLAI